MEKVLMVDDDRDFGRMKEGLESSGKAEANFRGREKGEKKRILIIEDEDPLKKLLREVLEQGQRFEVKEASDGEEGLKILGEWPADLIITDLVMPNLNGMEIIWRVRKSELPVKILAISGGALVGPGEYLEGAKFLGAHRTLSKPFSVDEFLKTVQVLIDNSPR